MVLPQLHLHPVASLKYLALQKFVELEKLLAAQEPRELRRRYVCRERRDSRRFQRDSIGFVRGISIFDANNDSFLRAPAGLSSRFWITVSQVPAQVRRESGCFISSAGRQNHGP